MLRKEQSSNVPACDSATRKTRAIEVAREFWKTRELMEGVAGQLVARDDGRKIIVKVEVCTMAGNAILVLSDDARWNPRAIHLRSEDRNLE